VAVGAAACVGDASAAARLFTRLTALRSSVSSQLTDLSLSALASTSALLSTELAFCTEQFLAHMLSAARRNPDFIGAHVVVPWICGARAATCAFPQTRPVFRCYAFPTLVADVSALEMTPDALLVIDRILEEEPVMFVVCLYAQFQARGEANTDCLAHIVRHRPDEASRVVTELLRVSTWFLYAARESPTAYDMAIEFAVHGVNAAFAANPDLFQPVTHICYATRSSPLTRPARTNCSRRASE
jgi:hypothetical protein